MRNLFWFGVGVLAAFAVALATAGEPDMEPTVKVHAWAIIFGCDSPLGVAVVDTDGKWHGARVGDLGIGLRRTLLASGKEPYVIHVCTIKPEQVPL